MKLGICYMVFDGEELLEFAIKSIRNEVDYVSVTYQSISYHGNLPNPLLLQTLYRLKSLSLIDELVHYETDLSLTPKENELKLRNLGLETSRRAGCTHHISSDVDELYQPEQLRYAKENMDGDFCMAPCEIYYKEPTYLVVPPSDLLITFIHPINNIYQCNLAFPFKVEITRRLQNYIKYKVFNKNEITIHHMSYVRKDMKAKFANSCNKDSYNVNRFINQLETHQLGDKVYLLPDYLTRRTKLVPNTFGIHF